MSSAGSTLPIAAPHCYLAQFLASRTGLTGLAPGRRKDLLRTAEERVLPRPVADWPDKAFFNALLFRDL